MTEVSPTAPGTSEAYNLTIAFPRATLTAGTVYGAMRGIETFSQLVGAGHTIAAQTIADFPRCLPHRLRGQDTAFCLALPLSLVANTVPFVSCFHCCRSFPHRGVMLDTARHFLPAPSAVGESSVILLTPPLHPHLKHLPQVERGCSRITELSPTTARCPSSSASSTR